MSELLDFENSNQNFFDDAQLDMFLTIKRSRSNDGFLGNLIYNQTQVEKKRNLIFHIEDACNMKADCQTIKVFKNKEKKIRKKGECDYKKNICGYITKKIIRQFVSKTYQGLVQVLCEKYGCQYGNLKSFYLGKIERITGPSHIPILLIPENEAEVPLKNAFREFFEWFLKERYIRYLILEGKMQRKQTYIRYKNQALVQLIRANKVLETEHF